MSNFKIWVPATSANLGPGFDCLGLALGMHLQVDCCAAPSFALELVGEGSETLPRDASNLMVRALMQALDTSVPPAVSLRVTNPIPLQRGLGSSAAAAIAGFALGQLLATGVIDRHKLLAAATTLEGHADNAAAAIYGGLVVCGVDPLFAIVDEWPTQLKLCVVIPALRVSTAKARQALPKQLPFADAVATSTRLAQLLAALRARRFDLLAPALNDRLHQPYRLPLGRGLEAALAAMAAHPLSLGAWLSGSGPTLIGIGTGDVTAIGQAGVDSFRANGVEARQQTLEVDRRGIAHEISTK